MMNEKDQVMSEPHEWAAASYQAATTDAVGYCHKRNDACWSDTNNKRLDEDEEQRTIQMTDEYLDAFKPVVELGLKQAGVRLAHMINLTFDPDYDPEDIEGD